MADSILQKPIAGLLLLAGAAGGPYLWYETGIGNQIWQSATSGADSAVDSAGGALGGLNPTSSSSNLGYLIGNGATSASGTPGGKLHGDPFSPNTSALHQLPVVSLAEILRFDITPEWVLARFPRVTTLLSELNLDGLRTPLITGSSPGDLAGTLTYYFDRYKRLQRVSIHATAGDPTRYVMELQQAYKMSQEPSLGGSLYVIKWNGVPGSVMHISPASVVYSDLNYGRYNLFLELNQAGLEYGLSQEAQQLIQAGRHTQRW